MIDQSYPSWPEMFRWLTVLKDRVETLPSISAEQVLTGTLDPSLIPPIPWALVLKAGSSLGDLETRSAGDLSSGTLLGARMPALTGDISSVVGAVATTLATVNTSPGTYGSGTAIPLITVNGKGLVTNVMEQPIQTGALTRVNDTNVTATLTGTPLTALLKDVTITLGWTGTLGVARGGTGTGTAFTAGSVVFAGASGVYAQDNAHLFWDDTNNLLGIGTATPAAPLHVSSPGFGANAYLAKIEGAGQTLFNNDNFSVARNLATGAGSAAIFLTVGMDSTTDYDKTRNAALIGAYLAPSLRLEASVTTHTGVEVHPNSLATGGSWTVTSQIGLKIDAGSKGANTTITNAIGMSIDSPTAGSNNYALITNGTANVGFGTAVPSTALEVARTGADAVIRATCTTSGIGRTDLKGYSTATTLPGNLHLGGANLIFTNRNTVTDGNFTSFFNQSEGGTQRTGFAFVNDTQATDASSIAFLTHNGTALAERMRLSAAGHLGLGIAPTTALDIARTSADAIIRSISTTSGHGRADLRGYDSNTVLAGSLHLSGGSIVLVNKNSTDGNFTCVFNQSDAGNQRTAMVFINDTQGTDASSIAFLTHNGSSIAERVRIAVSGRMGLGVTVPTANLHIQAGTATASTAPLKFTSGTVLTTAEAGAVEFTTDDFFATITTGAARKAFILDNGSRLTSGKVPVATTNGRLIDGPTLGAAGLKIAAIQASARATAQIAAVASVATFANGAADASYIVSANVNVTTSTTHSFSVQVDYTDETNTAQTLTLTFSQLTAALASVITNVTGAGPYEGLPLQIRCKASTSITVKTTGTFTAVVYNVEGLIQQVA